MLATIIDRVEARLARHSKALSIAAAIWFWFGIAVYARFIRLPDWPWFPERAIFWAGIAFNAVWWGFLRPEIERRRAARSTADPA